MSSVPKDLRPMSEFDPTQPAVLHVRGTDEILPWTGEHADGYLIGAVAREDGTVELNGVVFDGWGEALGG